MTEISSNLRGWTRRNFLKTCGAAGALMLFPWLAYAAESDELEAKADNLEASAADKQAEADALAAKLEGLQTQLNEAIARYNTANKAHEDALAAMDEAQSRIDAAEIRLDELQEQLADRAATIYREGEPSFIDVFFGSQTFDDFVTNWDAMQRIGEQDARLVQETKDVKAEAEAAHAEYSKQEKVAAKELDNATVAKQEVEKAQATIQAEYDAMNDEIAALHSEIEQVRMSAKEARRKEAEAKRAAEEALRRQQEAAAAAAQSSPQYSQPDGSTSSTPSVSVDGWVNPAPGKFITSGFGWRASIGDYHQGVDLSCNYEPVYCMAAGTVETAGWFGSGGLAVTVNHGNGITSWYLHASSLCVSPGQQVSAGQQVIVSGNTGFSTGAHLHFQINVNGVAVNPTTYFGW